MRTGIIALLISLWSLSANCQISQLRPQIKTTPVLIVHRYVNNKQKSTRLTSKNIVLKSRTQIYTLKDSADLFLLPFIAKDDTLDLMVKLGRRSISMNRIPGWRLQSGATVSIGQIDNFAKVISIAKEDDYMPTDKEYKIWNSRYRISPEGSTIDISDITRFREISYIELIGFGHGTLLQIWQGKLKHNK